MCAQHISEVFDALVELQKVPSGVNNPGLKRTGAQACPPHGGKTILLPLLHTPRCTACLQQHMHCTFWHNSLRISSHSAIANSRVNSQLHSVQQCNGL